MKVKIVLHGHLRDRIGKEYVMTEALTAYEALKSLSNNYPQLKAPLDIGRWRVKIKDYETRESLYVPLYTDELHVYPIFRTAKDGNVFQTVVGAVLVVTGAALMYFGQGWGVYLVETGIALMTSGIIGMLMPQPKIDNDNSSLEASRYLGTPKNTTKVGTRIQIGYGLYKVGGHYISFDINASDIIVKRKGGILSELARQQAHDEAVYRSLNGHHPLP